ncbi:MAG TPA: hypothetical protein VIO36_08140, partial [Anaerolineaceae bacterium]
MLKPYRIVLVLVFLMLALAACSPKAVEPPAAAQPTQASQPGLYDKELAVQAFQKGGCTACHVIPGVPGAVGTIGPDLSAIGEEAEDRIESGEYTGAAKDVTGYLHEAIANPDAFISPNCGGKPCQKGLMPASLVEALTSNELNAVVNYMAELDG